MDDSSTALKAMADASMTLADVERSYIAAVMRVAGSVSAAAKRLGIHRRSLQRKLKLQASRDLL